MEPWKCGSFLEIGGPQHTAVLIIGTPKRVPLTLGDPHIHMNMLSFGVQGFASVFQGSRPSAVYVEMQRPSIIHASITLAM